MPGIQLFYSPELHILPYQTFTKTLHQRHAIVDRL